MMQSIPVVLCLLTLASIRVYGHPVFDVIDEDINQVDNTLQVNGGMNLDPRREPWVKITLAPTKMVRRESGSTVELECEASGSPIPVITWFKDHVPITELVFEDNIVNDLSYTAMAVAGSKLVINNYQPSGKDIYTCVARSGPALAKASTIVHTTHHKSHQLFNDAEMNLQMLQRPTKPMIVSYIRTVMEDMGHAIVLPCRATGNPKSDIAWFYNDVEPVPVDGLRHEITSSGDLVFRKLGWADMGQYTCVARNSFGEDTSTTFVYPLAEEK